MKNILIFLLIITSLMLTSCDNNEFSKIIGQELNDTNKITWLGRTYYNNEEKKVYFYNTATGFTVTFEGSILEIRIHSTNSSLQNSKPYFNITIDDEVLLKGKRVTVDKNDQILRLTQDLNYGVHTVTFLKSSEPQDSTTSISEIITDGKFLNSRKLKDTKVLLLGGSGMSGHGALGSGGLRTTENSDSLSSFGYLVAKELDADFQFVSNSGWGLKWGYNPTNNNGKVNISTAFDKVGIAENESLIDIDYDPNLFKPDYIIVNLGGNDYNSYVSKQQNKREASKEFQKAVKEFVEKFHRIYPEAYIIWTHTGSNNGSLAETIISDIDPKGLFIDCVKIGGVGSNGDPVGANNHASSITHEKNAKIILEFINTL